MRNGKRLHRNFFYTVALLVFFIIACHPIQKKEVEMYICPMDTTVVQKGPGICPVCKMDLITKTEFEKLKNDDLLNTLLRPTDEFVIASVKLAAPEERNMADEFSATGKIEYDTRALTAIASRYGGRIEKLYVKYLFQPVKKGQRLFDIYSPEIVTAQQNFIYLLKNDSLASRLINAEKQKLILYGLTDSQIETIVKTRKAEYALPVFSPCDGYVYESAAAGRIQESSKNNMGESVPMGGKPAEKNNPSGTLTSAREGIYINKGQTIFSIVNPENIWAVLKINSPDISKTKLHQKVILKIENSPDSTIKGTIDFIEPFYESKSVSMNARVYLENKTNKIRPGSWVEAKIQGDTVKGLWIQKKSLLDIGKNKIVWLKKEKSFEAHKITTGAAINDRIEITDGLSKEDSIAFDAHYLMDSESFIKIKEDE